MEQFNKVKEALEALTVDAEKFFVKGNNSAGTRLRKGLQEVKKLSTDLRKLVSETKEAAKEVK